MSLVGDVRAACEARVATAAGYPPATRRARANTGFDPGSVGNAYALTDVRVTYTEPRTWPAENAVMETRGIFLVDLFFPLTGGPATADAVAQAVLDVFPYGLHLTSGDTTALIRRAVRAGGLKQDAWYHVPVTITWDVRHVNNL